MTFPNNQMIPFGTMFVNANHYDAARTDNYDVFARTVRHEKEHSAHLIAWWGIDGSGHSTLLDRDNDMIPNWIEDYYSVQSRRPVPGTTDFFLNPDLRDVKGNGFGDEEEYTRAVVASAGHFYWNPPYWMYSEDWSMNGVRWRNTP